MFRNILNTARSVSRVSVIKNANVSGLRGGLLLSTQQSQLQNKQIRFYSHAPELTKEIISERVIELLESYSKTPEGVTINENTSFSKDLGYDSFDVVEVVMELEYEFSILIPDKEADEIKTVGQAVDFISRQPDAC
ncbi:hypothetical protein CANINC_003462 [Pichia inconspicua]|uniref:Acyl carrier protein n=1 Tax=Pichia inconspicua TaxID=52247 RepID=A0A4T0WYM3_9ASCO|nr:hypothetical protein CANINC_003462 [[Candida] inconspicua]